MDQEDCFHLGIKALIRNCEGEILLLKAPSKNKDTYWDIPGGRIQKGESFIQTLQREVEEETGLQKIENITPFIMMLTHIRIPLQNKDVGLILSVYLCEVQSLFTPRLSSEHIDFGWFTPKEAAQLLKKYSPEFMKKLAELECPIPQQINR